MTSFQKDHSQFQFTFKVDPSRWKPPPPKSSVTILHRVQPIIDIPWLWVTAYYSWLCILYKCLFHHTPRPTPPPPFNSLAELLRVQLLDQMAQNAELRRDLQVKQTAYENERDKYARLARAFSRYISASAREYNTLRNAHTASVAAAAKAFADLQNGLRKAEDEKRKDTIRRIELLRSPFGRDSPVLGEDTTRKGLLAIEPAKLNTGAFDTWKGFAAKPNLPNVVAQPDEDAWICSICTRDNTGGSECWTCNASRGGLKRKRF